MNIKELRIGNWVLVNDPYYNGIKIPLFPAKIVGINTELKKAVDVVSENLKKEHFNTIEIQNVEGIPTSIEWLSKLGFKKDTTITTREQYAYNNFVIAQMKESAYWYLWSDLGEYQEGIELYYVHQLQNLYFVLTGDELVWIKIINDEKSTT